MNVILFCVKKENDARIAAVSGVYMGIETSCRKCCMFTFVDIENFLSKTLIYLKRKIRRKNEIYKDL